LSLKSFMSSMDVLNFESQIGKMLAVGQSLPVQPPPEQDGAGTGRSIFMDVYSVGARWHMSKYGSTQRQLAVISAKNHYHSSLNPLAQIQKDMTVEEVLADKLVSYPLTRPMCAPIGDGATAAILCSEKYLKKLSDPRPVKVRASILGSGTDRDLEGEDIGHRLSRKAYEMAGVGPEDIDLAEVHDATAYGELHQTEALGFCPEGEGGTFAESGATKLGGKLPINTSGGLESRGHPIGASGMAQIHEIVTQLRGEAGKRQVDGARLGLTENGGGTLGFEEASMTIHVFARV
jgi:acetyl-CoA acyltransferase